MLYDHHSAFQHIQVLDTVDFGRLVAGEQGMPRLLVLDDQANLAESDLVYTNSLMADNKEDFAEKQVGREGEYRECCFRF